MVQNILDVAEIPNPRLVFLKAKLHWPREGAKFADALRALASLLYLTFLSSQGRQYTQPAQVLFILMRMKEDGIILGNELLAALEERAAKLRIPKKHARVSLRLQRIVFRFWALNVVDIAKALYTMDPIHLPDEAQLKARIRALGGKKWDSSFIREEVDTMIVTFAKLRRLFERSNDENDPFTLTTESLMLEMLALDFLEIEARWVGREEGSEDDEKSGRPVESGPDRRAVKFVEHIQKSRNDQELGLIGPWEDMYLCFAQALEKAVQFPDNPLYRQIYEDYMELIELYNHYHPDEDVVDFHTPLAA